MAKIFDFFIKNLKKHHLILMGIGIVLILAGVISWNVYYSKFDIFEKREKYFLETVQDYYEYHAVYLPKEGQIKTITLEELYEKGQIDTLYTPKSTKLCDTNSWVKVYNDGKDYHYHAYLKCDKFESDTDHEGPVITLKGEDTIYVSLGKQYEELGVEKVSDNVDGNISIDKVVIDSSKVNVKKVGNYNVTYTVRDNLNNETVVIRKVVVNRNLTDTVKDATDESNYYRGDTMDNYLLFSGMLYRIINVNEDGTVKLISNEILNNLRADYDNYENSNIDQYLNNEYLDIIHDQSYLVDTEFCVGNVDSMDDVSKNCDKKLKRKVAILDIQVLQNSFLNSASYLCSLFNYAVSSKVNGSSIVTSTGNNCLASLSSDILLSIRPVITIKSDITIVSGNGTQSNPYKLNDYSYGKKQDKINTRLSGEYVNYSGSVYRVMNVDKNKNVVLISVDGISKNTSEFLGRQYLKSYASGDKKFVFNVDEPNNPGYILNNDYIDYINDKYIVETEYEIPLNVSGKMYNEYETKKVSAKLSLPKTYDLFAGEQLNTKCYMYLYVDESIKDTNAFYISTKNSRVYDNIKNTEGEYYLRIVITIKGDMLIKSGNGTINSPYYVR